MFSNKKVKLFYWDSKLHCGNWIKHLVFITWMMQLWPRRQVNIALVKTGVALCSWKQGKDEFMNLGIILSFLWVIWINIGNVKWRTKGQVITKNPKKASGTLGSLFINLFRKGWKRRVPNWFNYNVRESLFHWRGLIAGARISVSLG